MKYSKGGASWSANADPASLVHKLYRGTTPWPIRKSHPPAVDFTAEPTSLNPCGWATTPPRTKFRLTRPGPQTSPPPPRLQLLSYCVQPGDVIIQLGLAFILTQDCPSRNQ